MIFVIWIALERYSANRQKTLVSFQVFSFECGACYTAVFWHRANTTDATATVRALSKYSAMETLHARTRFSLIRTSPCALENLNKEQNWWKQTWSPNNLKTMGEAPWKLASFTSRQGCNVVDVVSNARDPWQRPKLSRRHHKGCALFATQVHKAV